MSESSAERTFAGLRRASLDTLSGAAVAILGAGEGSPYEVGKAGSSAAAPRAIRKASAGLPARRQFDYDIGRVLLAPGQEHLIVDLGDLPTDPSDPEGNRADIEAAIRTVLEAGAVPVVLGGDDSVPVPVLRAYEGRGPLTILQIDAHVDWADVIKGNPVGNGSVMRRIAELDWVRNEVQVGIRGLGSGTPDQLADAAAWGSRIVTMREFRSRGPEAIAQLVPEGAGCFVTIDVDGLDPSIMPAVTMRGPGGLLYDETLDLFRAVAARAPIVGVAMVEFVPERDDPHGLAAFTAARLLLSTIGLLALPGVAP
jgi:agmatinase